MCCYFDCLHSARYSFLHCLFVIFIVPTTSLPKTETKGSLFSTGRQRCQNRKEIIKGRGNGCVVLSTETIDEVTWKINNHQRKGGKKFSRYLRFVYFSRLSHFFFASSHFNVQFLKRFWAILNSLDMVWIFMRRNFRILFNCLNSKW